MATQGRPPAEPSTEGEFVIARVFDAPRELVWKVWTDCQHLVHWWGPQGFAMRHCSLDLRPGGLFHYCLQAPEGPEVWGKFVFREIVPPERFVCIVAFSDAEAGTTRHPLSPGWPLQTLSTVTFAEQDGKTTISVRWVPFSATDAERATFVEGRESMQQGWSGTFDQLEAYLARA